MDKRRNTLDRLQRLGFGRKSPPSGSVNVSTSSHTTENDTTTSPHITSRNRKFSEKSEKLKELTGLLKIGHRSLVIQQPVLPPRRSRIQKSANNSCDKMDAPIESERDIDVLPMMHQEDNENEKKLTAIKHTLKTCKDICYTNKNNTLKNITHCSNTNEHGVKEEKHVQPAVTHASPPPPSALPMALHMSKPLLTTETLHTTPSGFIIRPTHKLNKSEGRAVIAWYAQKGVPFRSASFSQIGYNSGKSKKSSLSALRDHLRREKAIESTSPNNSIIGSVIENFTWPRKKVNDKEDKLTLMKESARSTTLDQKSNYQHDSVPLRRNNSKLDINLSYGQDSCVDHIMESPNVIPIDEVFTADVKLEVPEKYEAIITTTMAASHAKMESLTDTTQCDNDLIYDVNAGTHNTAQHNLLNDTNVNSDNQIFQEDNNLTIKLDVQNMAMLREEHLHLETPPENFMQTATTCLIPLPVFECIGEEWNFENPPSEWIEVKSEDFGILPKTTQPILIVDECKTSTELAVNSEQEHLLETTPLVNCALENIANDKTTNDLSKILKENSEEVFDCNDNIDITAAEQSLLDNITTRHSTDERRKIDMSKRRKGIYIEYWQEPVSSEMDDICNSNNILTLDVNDINMKDNKHIYPSPHIHSIDLNTTESNRVKNTALSNLKNQCSDEQDNLLFAMEKNFQILRTDSLSDTESDRTSPSRGRNSPSFKDNYAKRYLKRPLRGPYGQMLEAEMKKPSNKMHFEEILDNLKENERLPQPKHQYQDVFRKNLDVKICDHSAPHSCSMCICKSTTLLPVPVHTRAISTPNVENNSNDDICTRTCWTHSNSNSNSSTEKHTSSSAHSSYNATLLGRNLAHKNKKKGYSEISQSKRSQSMNGGEKPHHLYQEKRNLNISVNNNIGIDKIVRCTSSSTTNTMVTYSASGINIFPTPELLAELLKGSSEKLLSEQRHQISADTRTHIVQEIFRNEQSYVESLQNVVSKYFKILKMPEYAGMIESRTVDEIFFMVPEILKIHEKFLFDLRNRLDNWDNTQKVGDAFMETFSKLEVLEIYTSFVNNCSRAKNAIRTTIHQRPSFAKFLEATAKEDKGKLTLDNLLIKPVQKFPNYEMLFQRLLKNTDDDHPDQKHLQNVLKLVHDILVHINCKEKEILENGQREAALRGLETVIEGITELIAPDRQFLLFDLVTIPSDQDARKERGLFLFNDLLVLTSIKKRSGTIKKPSISTCLGTVMSTLDTNRYKFLTKISLDNLEIVKSKDENLKRIMTEIKNLAEDCNKLQKIANITASLRYPHQNLDDIVRELHGDVQRQLSEKQTNDAQLNTLPLTVTSVNGMQKLNIVFSKAEKRSQWEEMFNEAKQKLAATLERHLIPQFLTSIPIRKTRAGLQFTCAAATLNAKHDVWVCNSDGYVGQVCILSLYPEPNITSCNGVCNARILCVTSVPAYSSVTCVSPTIKSSTLNDDQMQHKQHYYSSLPPNSYTQHLLDYRKSISPNHSPLSTLCTPDRRHFENVDSNQANLNNTISGAELNLSSSDEEFDTTCTMLAPQNENFKLLDPHLTHRSGRSTHTLELAAPTTLVDANVDESDSNQSTMWIGTEDGCVHIYNSTDNIRIKKNRIKIEHHSAVYSILYLDNRVFVSLANGEVYVYLREGYSWNNTSSHSLTMGTVVAPVTKLLNVNGEVWCAIQGVIKVLNVETLRVTNEIQVSSDSKPITNMTVSNNRVWISIQNSALIKCFHSSTHQLITEVNLAPAVNKMLSNCDEIIRQHKAACLRVTSLLSCQDLIWIGTSAGVLLTLPSKACDKQNANIVPTGLPHGHTGHVRFLTYVEPIVHSNYSRFNNSVNELVVNNRDNSDLTLNDSSAKSSKIKSETKIKNILIISGGDGYEDFRNSGPNSLSEIAGREDSTNHLLIWQI